MGSGNLAFELIAAFAVAGFVLVLLLLVTKTKEISGTGRKPKTST